MQKVPLLACFPFNDASSFHSQAPLKLAGLTFTCRRTSILLSSGQNFWVRRDIELRENVGPFVISGSS
ncbi:hypothetical protein GOP47_0012605 [Adiantum capillus-veneris]|uniref:Uncharacterized protein n=1 Tax=Adiantum capillus-veneris TaxID=13818 RepID=A0A9D4UR02_ADICA|nr:hypothetical protein GOP47_0012605 [Adiantum capillus-veneris]